MMMRRAFTRATMRTTVSASRTVPCRAASSLSDRPYHQLSREEKKAISDANWAKEKESGAETVEVISADDPWVMADAFRLEHLLDDVLKIPANEQEAFMDKFEVSRGNMTLEWCHPVPMPFHTYDELPIIKELDEAAE